MENSELPEQQARPGIEPGTFCLPVFESRTPLPLERPRMDSLTSMPYSGFEPIYEEVHQVCLETVPQISYSPQLTLHSLHKETL